MDIEKLFFDDPLMVTTGAVTAAGAEGGGSEMDAGLSSGIAYDGASMVKSYLLLVMLAKYELLPPIPT